MTVLKDPTPEELQEAIQQGEFVAARLTAFVGEHPDMQYIGSSILSYGIGLMLGEGAPHDEVLELCQHLVDFDRQKRNAGIS